MSLKKVPKLKCRGRWEISSSIKITRKDFYSQPPEWAYPPLDRRFWICFHREKNAPLTLFGAHTMKKPFSGRMNSARLRRNTKTSISTLRFPSLQRTGKVCAAAYSKLFPKLRVSMKNKFTYAGTRL